MDRGAPEPLAWPGSPHPTPGRPKARGVLSQLLLAASLSLELRVSLAETPGSLCPTYFSS